MFRNTFDSEIQPAMKTLSYSPRTRRATPAFRGVRLQHVASASVAAALSLSASAVLAQSYVPAIVPTASTTLYTSAAVISPGRVAVDRAGNVYMVAVVGSSSTLMEIPAATQTGTNAAPVTLITGLGQYNSKAAVVDANGNLWASTGNQEQENSSDYVDLVEIPALNGVPNTGLVGSGISLATADANHCTATGTAVCTVLNYKLNDAAATVAGPQVLDFSIDASGNIIYVDIGDNSLPSGKARVVKSNVYNGNGTVLATVTQDYNGQVAEDGAANVYYCSPGASTVSLVTGGSLTPVGMTAKLGSAAVTAPTGISGDIYGDLFIAGGAQLSEVPFEGAALNFLDEFGIITGLTNSISSGGALDQNGNYYFDSNGTSATKILQLQINTYNFGSVPVGSTVSSSSTPVAPSLNLYVNVAPSSGISSYFPTGSPTTNTTSQFLQSFPYSGTKSFSGGSSFTVGSNYTITMNFQPIHPGLLLGSYTPRSGADDQIINLAGVGVGPEPLFLPGSPSLLFTAAATSQTLNAPQGLAVDSYGDIFVADTGNGKVVADCIATTTDNEDGTGGTTNNTFCPLSGYSNAVTQLGTGFVSPVAIALDGAQSLYVLDSAATGTPVTLINGQSVASTALVSASTTFGGTALSKPMGIALDAYTNIYIADTGNNRIVKAHQFGATVTDNIAYVPSTTSFAGIALNGPQGLAVDGSQNLYIADTGNNRVVVYSAAGATSVLPTGSITLGSPYAVAVYPSGQVVVSDKANGVVLLNGTSSQVLSFTSAYPTTGARGLALDAAGNIYVSNTTGNQVLELNVTSPQSIAFPNTGDGAVSALNTETVIDEGNASLVLSGLAASNTNFAIDSSSTCTATSTVTTGKSCTVVTKFTPQAVGPLTGSVTLTDNQLGYSLNTGTSNETATFGTNGTQALNLTGTATSSGAPQTITFPAPASPITYTTTPIMLAATASSSLPVTFTVVSGPGSITGTSLTVTGVGTIVVAANQAGSINFSAAPQVTQSIVVNQAPQTINFAPTTPVLYTTMPITLTATASSGLVPVFSIVSGPGTISGTSLTITGVGTIVVSATQAGNATYAAATPVQASIVVSPLGTVNTPTFSFPGGTYNSSRVGALVIADGTTGAAIYYTTNGSTPTTGSTLYTAMTTLTLSGTETVNAIAVAPGFLPSAVASASYTIDTATEGLTQTLNPSSLTLHPGASGTINISVTPQNGINTTLSFLCTGLPVGAACTFNPASVATGPAQAAVTTVLTVTAPATISSLPNRQVPLLPGTTLAVAVCLFGWRKRKGVKLVLMLAALSFGLSIASGCGSPSSETSTITVAVSGDSVRTTSTFTLLVQ
jgi:sugar lactone lactonase YvrE